ncbi:MAG: hypothetical protein NC238_15680 [Dehalobacter sp.]|nr:hypothetical protein [Dehalobacter sp.]
MSGNNSNSDTAKQEFEASHATKEVTFRVFTDSESGLICASGVDHAIHTHAGSWDVLMKYVHEAVECHFEVPYTQVKITLIEVTDVEAQESRDVGPHCD